MVAKTETYLLIHNALINKLNSILEFVALV